MNPTGTQFGIAQKRSGRPAMRHAAVLFAAIALTAAGAAPAAVALGSGPSATALSTRDRVKIEAMVSEELQRLLDRQPRSEGQSRVVRVKVGLEAASKALVIDFSKGYLPKHDSERLKEQRHGLAMSAMALLGGSVAVEEVRFLIDGRELQHYFPAELPKSSPRPPAALNEPENLAVVSAGHGRYFHYDDNAWVLQRPLVNGVQEDLITQYFAERLEAHLLDGSRGGGDVGIVRSHSSALYGPSNLPWWHMSARTYLETVLPGREDIWGFSTYNGPDRQAKHDINARPRFADHVQATALLSIHTNAEAGGNTASGSLVAYHTGREASRELGASVLCYMSEQIHAVPGYAAYPVPAAPVAFSDKGENSGTYRPAIIVEVGFHTNPSDAAALKNANFRDGAMKGVEKGYRMWRTGKPCATFAVSSIPAAVGYTNTPFQATVDFQGYPQQPIRAETKVVSCAPGWTCANQVKTTTVLSENQLQYQIYCTNSQQTSDATFTVDTVLVDADGVRTAPVRNSYTCKKPV